MKVLRTEKLILRLNKPTSEALRPAVNVSCFQVRKLISDFAIILTILLFCGVDAYVGVDTPKLIVPREFKVGGGAVSYPRASWSLWNPRTPPPREALASDLR